MDFVGVAVGVKGQIEIELKLAPVAHVFLAVIGSYHELCRDGELREIASVAFGGTACHTS